MPTTSSRATTRGGSSPRRRRSRSTCCATAKAISTRWSPMNSSASPASSATTGRCRSGDNRVSLLAACGVSQSRKRLGVCPRIVGPTTRTTKEPAMQPEPRRGGSASFNRIHDNDAHFDDHQYQIGVEELVQQIKETADKLVRDHASRGDIKLLSTALKELRYSFKVFSAF